MAETKFTPGPWFWLESRINENICRRLKIPQSRLTKNKGAICLYLGARRNEGREPDDQEYYEWVTCDWAAFSSIIRLQWADLRGTSFYGGPSKEDQALIAAAPDLYYALEAAKAYDQIRQTGRLSDEYHALIKPWLACIETEVGHLYPFAERFPGWHRDGMCSLVNRRRDAALANARGEVANG